MVLIEANIRSRFRATGIWPLNRNAINFSLIPCTHMNAVLRDTTSKKEVEFGQVPKTPLIAETLLNEDLEEEVVETLAGLVGTTPKTFQPQQAIVLLKVSREEISVYKAPREAFVDYIITLEQYIESMKAKIEKKCAIEAAKEEKKLHKGC
ncbi:hypothetical protein L7F22_044675 [Adiantum nelumboides]|nr:hypothetical protein [Adiantum nelumboides]